MVVSNKKLISELKDFNKDLEKHIGGVDIELMAEAISKKKELSSSKDFNTLFAENLLDMRTELMMIRKNLIVDIEGMVMRVVSEQQNQFAENMNNIFLKTVVEMKNSLNDNLTMFANEVSEVKKSHDKLLLENSNLTNTLKGVSEEISSLKSDFESVEETVKNTRIDLKFSELDNLIRISNTQSFQTKTRRDRILPMNSYLKKYLMEMESNFVDPNTDFVSPRAPFQSDYVICGKYGEKIGCVRKAYKRLLDRLEINNASLHTLRHTFASMCIMNNVDLYTIKEFLGHSRVTTTEIYTHISQKFKLKSIEKLTNAIQIRS